MLGGKERERSRKGKVGLKWEESRKKFLEDKKLRIEEVERRREEGEEWCGKLVRESREKDRKKRWEKIMGSNYNKWYKVMRGKGIPEYLKKGWGESK